MRSVFSIIIFLVLSANVFAQSFVVNGKVTDELGKPVPFASVYVKDSSRGTSANSEGVFQIKLEAGRHQLVFKAIGYRQQSTELLLSADQILDVSLLTEIYQLDDVLIRPDGEDPAYDIIRKAIGQRKKHLRDVESYTANVYIKGMQKLLAAPKKFLGKDVAKMGKEIGLDSNRQGIIYLSESESKLSFIRPDHYREEMIASKVSGSNRAFSFNRASDMKVNFYENYQNWEGLSNRPIISPIADNALFYYQYKYLGSATENGLPVNKIQVIPRRGTDPVFRGFIYILEDSWRLHGADLYLTKAANLNFVDTLKVNQQFIPVSGKNWMPSSVRFDFTGGVFGFRFGGYFIAVYKDYDLQPDLKRKDFVEVLRITKEVNKMDSAYWVQARPIPLTQEEKSDYIKKDTLAARKESKPYLDSLDRVSNKFKPVSFLIGGGYNPRNRFNKEFYRFSSVASSLFYNTVEGFGINYSASYRKQIDSLSDQFYSLSGKLRYGFSSRDWYGSVSGNIPLGKSSLGLDAGSDVLDLNNLGSISTLGNSINSLFYERNYLKLYEKKFVSLSLTRRITGGLLATLSSEWASRKSLQNSTDYTFIDDKARQFTSNNPFDPLEGSELFPENQLFKTSLRAVYEFSKEYATYPTGRVYQPSRYPKLGLSYTHAYKNLLGSDTGFDLLSFDISKSDIKLGLYGKSAFWIGGGKFLNPDQVHYPDFKHFVGTQSLGYIPKINTFLFLDYYRYSTSDKYFETHIEHNFSGFITNKLPLVRKLKLQEVAGFNFLATPALKDFKEVYFGLQYLSFRALYGFSYQGSRRTDRGFRIAYGF